MQMTYVLHKWHVGYINGMCVAQIACVLHIVQTVCVLQRTALV